MEGGLFVTVLYCRRQGCLLAGGSGSDAKNKVAEASSLYEGTVAG